MLNPFVLLTITGSVYDSSNDDVIFTIFSICLWTFLIAFAISRIIQFWPAVKGEKTVRECEMGRPSEETQILYWFRANSDLEIESVVKDFVEKNSLKNGDKVRGHIKLLLEQNGITCPLDIDRLPLCEDELCKDKKFCHEDGGPYGSDIAWHNQHIAIDIILALQYGLAYSGRCRTWYIRIRASQTDSPKQIKLRRDYAFWLEDVLKSKGKNVKMVEHFCRLRGNDRYQESFCMFDPTVY